MNFIRMRRMLHHDYTYMSSLDWHAMFDDNRRHTAELNVMKFNRNRKATKAKELTMS